MKLTERGTLDAGPGAPRAGERGTSLIEAAIVLPLVFLFIFGVIEVGWTLFHRSTVQNMSVVGARAGSGQGNDALGDHAIVEAVEGATSSMSTDAIKTVVVYRATGPDDRVPTACKTNSVQDSGRVRGCNRYEAADLSLGEDQFGCTGPPGPVQKKDRFWCPTTRKIALEGPNGPPDYIGVYVEASGQSLFGVLGGAFTFTSDTVIRIEPRSKT